MFQFKWGEFEHGRLTAIEANYRNINNWITLLGPIRRFAEHRVLLGGGYLSKNEGESKIAKNQTRLEKVGIVLRQSYLT